MMISFHIYNIHFILHTIIYIIKITGLIDFYYYWDIAKIDITWIISKFSAL